MTDTATQNPSEWTLRYPSSADRPFVRRDIAYSPTAGAARRMDVYLPARATMPTGAVIIASGYPRAGLVRYFERSAREFGAARTWSELLTGHGIAAIAYDAEEPATDLPMLIEFLQCRGAEFGIDPTRLGILASSGNVPVALANLHWNVRCAAMLYGFMFDLDGTTVVDAAARQFGFANPLSHDAMQRIDGHVRMLIVRAGRDAFAGLNATIDAFVAAALARNSSLTLINHAKAPHAFDLVDESDETKRVIEQVVEFFALNLSEVK